MPPGHVVGLAKISPVTRNARGFTGFAPVEPAEAIGSYMEQSMLIPTSAERASRAGTVAEWLSVGCAIHCMAMPFLVAALPLVGMGFLLDERVETAVIGASAVLATFSIVNGYRTHGRRTVLGTLAMAVTLLAVGRVAPAGLGETTFTVAGAFTLAGTQFWNRRLAKPCGCKHHAHGETRSEALA